MVLCEEMLHVVCSDVVSYNTKLKVRLKTGRLEAVKLTLEMSASCVHAKTVTFNELPHSRTFAKGVDGTWKFLNHMKSTDMAIDAVTSAILVKGLMVYNSKHNVKRTFDLVLRWSLMIHGYGGGTGRQGDRQHHASIGSVCLHPIALM